MAGVTATYADVALLDGGALVAAGGAVVALAPTETQLLARLVQAQGRSVRRAVLEMAAWGIWEPVAPGALDAAIRAVQAKLATLGSKVTITGSPGQAYALAA